VRGEGADEEEEVHGEDNGENSDVDTGQPRALPGETLRLAQELGGFPELPPQPAASARSMRSVSHAMAHAGQVTSVTVACETEKGLLACRVSGDT
jgi:hypothetical protein